MYLCVCACVCARARTWVVLWLASPQSPRCGWSSCAVHCTSPKNKKRRGWDVKKKSEQLFGFLKIHINTLGLIPQTHCWIIHEMHICILYSYRHTLSPPFQIPWARLVFLCSFWPNRSLLDERRKQKQERKKSGYFTQSSNKWSSRSLSLEDGLLSHVNRIYDHSSNRDPLHLCLCHYHSPARTQATAC